ncbi:D-threonate kinase [Bordetella avium]|uniref:D-threonate kinase n=6 Tax=Bordetella avium TaxID=521 RepID=UPI0002EF44C3|nr:D-threonate kinase [Bordetella avium]AZY51583.1 four-carbon acid sugar kinase family protein [Bordetella avium]RIQ13553.1 four-carbon acid sugar kinase family protein [Bordetella avium]RIQ16493.1 four-carbon acid sugar kinase family protein [Bordetella avium]RIQ31251.1 four-carbon acid sugar kinase family protein [Bordetella avium]RIQ36900.1 four-carbon acid sugar kinase family protein [Bordetella avium]
MKPVVAIVADDLTGAGDTAVQFVRAGWSTRLSVDGAREALVSPVDVEVLAVTTHSRAMPDAEAGEAVRDNIERLRAAGASRLYKKVDSTLRGAFRAEIDAARAAWRADAIAVVCPAFPATGRTVENGVLLVNGEPVTATSAATDPVTPVTESHIPTLLGCAHVPVLDGEGPASLAARIAQAGPTVVVDARNEADLERLARAIGELGARALPVGAGGLAAPLARVWAGADQRSPVVVVVTSQHSNARAQIAALQAAGALCWSPSLAQLADAAVWQHWAEAQLRALAEEGPPDAGTLLLLAPAGKLDGLDADTVAQRLGSLAAQAVSASGAAGVVATGGDGARQVLAALGANGIALVDEVMGGVPLGTLIGGAAAGLPVVTKAGGFGSEDVLVRAVRAIRDRRFKR